MLARGSEMVSDLGLDLLGAANDIIWTQPDLGFNWFGAILGAFVTTQSVVLVSLFKRVSPKSAFQNELDQRVRQGLVGGVTAERTSGFNITKNEIQ